MRDCHKIGAWRGVIGWEQNKQWGQWVKVVCKKETNVATHSRHYFSERPRDWHCTGDGATRMHGLFAGGGGARFILGTDKTDARLKISTTTQ